MYSSFDVEKVQNVIEGSYNLLMYKRLPNSSTYVPDMPIKAMNILHSQIRYHFEKAINNFEDKIVLDIQTVQNIQYFNKISDTPINSLPKFHFKNAEMN